MANTHEYMEWGNEAGGMLKTQNSKVFEGTITAIDHNNRYATVNIDVDGTIISVSQVPFFYHCEDKSTVAEGHSAFADSDGVVLVSQFTMGDGLEVPTKSNTKIVGFSDLSVRHCRPGWIVIISGKDNHYFGTGTDPTYDGYARPVLNHPIYGDDSRWVTVFDPVTNAVATDIPKAGGGFLTFPIHYLDADFQAWWSTTGSIVPSGDMVKPVGRTFYGFDALHQRLEDNTVFPTSDTMWSTAYGRTCDTLAGTNWTTISPFPDGGAVTCPYDGVGSDSGSLIEFQLSKYGLALGSPHMWNYTGTNSCPNAPDCSDGGISTTIVAGVSSPEQGWWNKYILTHDPDWEGAVAAYDYNWPTEYLPMHMRYDYSISFTAANPSWSSPSLSLTGSRIDNQRYFCPLGELAHCSQNYTISVASSSFRWQWPGGIATPQFLWNGGFSMVGDWGINNFRTGKPQELTFNRGPLWGGAGTQYFYTRKPFDIGYRSRWASKIGYQMYVMAYADDMIVSETWNSKWKWDYDRIKLLESSKQWTYDSFSLDQDPITAATDVDAYRDWDLGSSRQVKVLAALDIYDLQADNYHANLQGVNGNFTTAIKSNILAYFSYLEGQGCIEPYECQEAVPEIMVVEK